jgi:Domain of unknown function (DUF5063)
MPLVFAICNQKTLSLNLSQLRRHSATIEGAEASDPAVFVHGCFRLISTLLAQVVDLEDVDGDSDTYPISNERYNGIVRVLKRRFAEHEHYRMVFDPYENKEEPILGSISDDLADIWREIARGLEALRNGAAENAIAHWRFSFACHWGCHHATHVLR